MILQDVCLLEKATRLVAGFEKNKHSLSSILFLIINIMDPNKQSKKQQNEQNKDDSTFRNMRAVRRGPNRGRNYQLPEPGNISTAPPQSSEGAQFR